MKTSQIPEAASGTRTQLRISAKAADVQRVLAVVPDVF